MLLSGSIGIDSKQSERWDTRLPCALAFISKGCMQLSVPTTIWYTVCDIFGVYNSQPEPSPENTGAFMGDGAGVGAHQLQPCSGGTVLGTAFVGRMVMNNLLVEYFYRHCRASVSLHSQF